MADRERGERIEALRRAKAERLGQKVTQQNMADHVGVSLRAAQEWHYGGGIDDEHLAKIIEFLETNADYLLRGGTPDLMASMNGEPQLDRIERKIDRLLALSEPDEDAGLEDLDAELDRQESAPDEADEDEPGTG